MSSDATVPAAAPLSVDEVLSSSVSMSELRGDGTDLLWLESRPLEDARMTVVRWRDGQLSELTAAPINVRTRIWEYGGGAWDCHDGVLVVSDLTSGRLVRLEGNQTTPITPADPAVRFGGLQVHPDRDLVLAVREDGRQEGEPVSSIVALSLTGPNADFGTVLVSGADFHAGPRLSEDDLLAWFQWNHPSMPWDETELRVARLSRVGDAWRTDHHQVVFAEPDTSAQHPQWDGRDLVFSQDGSGHWNIARWDRTSTRAVTDEPHDHDHPVWTLTVPTWSPVAGRVLCHRMVDGWPELGWAGADQSWQPLPVPDLADVDSVAVLDGRVFVLAGFATRPPALVAIDPSGEVEFVHQPQGEPEQLTTAPRSMIIDGPTGPVHAWYHAPTRDADQPPPTIVRTHGGPTSFASAAYNPSVTFWTSRGFAVVDVNYGGSTGFGRIYRERLLQNWGVVDVEDCVAVVEHLVAEGLADPARVSITGGSAGGYTTLQSLATTSTYTAGVSRYGIGDLEMLATDTHKFESRYLDSLVGRLPQTRQRYLDRSPIHHVENMSTPMLLLQGTEDAVVPPNQAEAIASAVRAKGLPVALELFEGEGHGFRSMAARRRALLAELAFHVQLWRLDTTDTDLPELDLR
ncbi:S9 family peptidase [Aestuariimicrobium ganziense]|uniref:S9 family peptidase n=1 Tax=Aestuariimicrobium ganziense TaxID=2773677 RepID=UPI0019438493|nr:prolyl oligopeptidase family serine peptidase [Aestuariimicrobium ganziense]